MPQAAELPEPIKPLARRNAVRLTHERFRADTQGLVKALQQALHEIEARHRSQREALRTAQVEEERRKGHENAIEVAKTGLVAEEGARRAPQKPERRPVTESISTGNLVFYVGAPILVGLIVIFVWIFSPPSLQPPPSVESRQLPEQARAPEQPPATAPPLFPAQPSDSSKPGTEHPPAAYEQPRRTGTLTSEPVQERLIPIEQPPPQAEVPRTGTLEPHIPAITTPTLHTSPTQIKGGWRIHAGAFASEDEARERLVLVRNSFEGSFPSAEFYTQKVIKGDKSLYRALAGGFTRDSAERACRLLKRKDIACIALKE